METTLPQGLAHRESKTSGDRMTEPNAERELFGITDEELVQVFKGTNFGASKPREIVAKTLLSIAGGYSTGHTAMRCCQELKLLGKNGRTLTKKGRFYHYHATRAALDKTADDTMSHLGELLYQFAELHPDDQSSAFTDAMKFYNERHVIKIEPASGYTLRLQRTTPLDTALDKPKMPGEWFPIETAPRDGTKILAAVKNTLGKWRRHIAFYAPEGTLPNGEDNYLDDDSEWAPEGWYHDTSDEERVNLFLPTHWQPLPLPPATKDAEEYGDA